MSRYTAKGNSVNPHQQSIKKSIMSRVRVLYAAFAIGAFAVFAMILVTQYGPNGTLLRNRSDIKCYKTLDIPATRGTIFSHDGIILTTDSPSYDLILDFTVLDMNDSEFNKLAYALADSLCRTIPTYSKSYFYNRLCAIRTKATRGGKGSQSQKLINTKVNQLQLDRIKGFPIFNKGRLGGGLIYTQDAERYKPFGTLAARTLGKPGQFGLEGAFNEALSGRDGQTQCVRLVRDVWVPVVNRNNKDVVNGHDLITTIDLKIQDIVEGELGKQMLGANATAGTAVVMDVQTGEVRAISNLSRYGETLRDDVNHAITMRCEPGSTFKLVSLMALLEEANYTLDHPVDCTESGRYMYQPRGTKRQFLIEDSHAVGQTNLKGAMEHSSNIGFVKMITAEYDDKPERFVDFINSLGINRAINMQLNGGLKPTIKDPRRKKETAWDAISLMKMAYGYALEFTPIHTLMLYNAVANGGVMVAPKLVNAISDNGHTIEKFDTEVINKKICSENTITLVQQTLEGVMEDGTGSLLKNKNFKIAGKTGTAQIALNNKGYMDERGGRAYLATFVGYFPADKPRYSLIVAIKTYHGPGSYNSYYGASLAGPAFKGIAERIYALDTDWYAPITESEVPALASVKGGDIHGIRSATGKLSIAADVGMWEHGWAVTSSDSVKVSVTPLQQSAGIMPTVTGMPLKDALYILESKGLSVGFTGKGKVVSQSINSGAAIREGDYVSIILRP